jgi:hypothetical protein
MCGALPIAPRAAAAAECVRLEALGARTSELSDERQRTGEHRRHSRHRGSNGHFGRVFLHSLGKTTIKDGEDLPPVTSLMR